MTPAASPALLVNPGRRRAFCRVEIIMPGTLGIKSCVIMLERRVVPK
jgi:hypothetical protein